MAPALAMDCSFLRDTADLPSVFGFDVAVKGIVEALLRYGTAERILFFHPPGWSSDQLSALRAQVHVRADLQFEPTTRIPGLLRRGAIGSWFQPDTTSDAVNYRAVFGAVPFPFSTVIHIACAPRLMRGQFMPLLLDGFAPCDSFICTSRGVRSAVRETLDYIADEMREANGAKLKYRGRLDVLPLGVDTERFKPRPQHELRRELGWPDDAFILLWFGRISVVDKGDLLPAVRVFRRLRQANPDKRLLFVVAGNDRQDIPFVPSIRDFAASLGVADHLYIVEGPPQEIRHKLFAAADVFTSPADNLQETFGITPVEAMASGTPQVVADWDGYKDTVVHGVTGYRIPTYWAHCDGDDETDCGIGGFGYQGFVWAQSVALDLRAYQAAVQRLIDAPELLAAMRAASRKRALEVFDWCAVIRSYEELWAELTEVARSLPASDMRAAPFLRSVLCRRFASFPTAMLEGSEPIRISDDGHRLLAGADGFPWHSPLERALVSEAALKAMLDSIDRAPGTLNELEARFTDGDSGRRPAVRRALMWGFKHGLLECAVSSRPDATAGFGSRTLEVCLS